MNSNVTITVDNANVSNTTLNGNVSNECADLGYWGMTPDEANQVEAGVNANAIDYQIEGKQSPPPAEEEPTPARSGIPDDTWLKADIIAWLEQSGSSLSDRALSSMTKADLLVVVQEVLAATAPSEG